MKFTVLTATAVFFGAVAAAPAIHPNPIFQRDVQELGVRVVPRDDDVLPRYPSVQHTSNLKRDDVNVLGLRHVIDEEGLVKRGKRITPKIVNRQGTPKRITPKIINRQGIPVKYNGNTALYAKRQDIPAEVAVKSVNGNIVEYVKRQDIPAEVAVKSVNGNIVEY
jgi:hypothetical protein